MEIFMIECDGCGRETVESPQMLNQKARVRVPHGWATVWLRQNSEQQIAHFCSPACWEQAKRAA